MLNSKKHLTAALMVAAAAVPASAAAQPNDLRYPAAGSSPAPVAATPVAVPAANDGGGSGFQWGDAGIGAGAAIVLIGAGTALTAGGRRRNHLSPTGS